jgi:hypothetical protein
MDWSERLGGKPKDSKNLSYKKQDLNINLKILIFTIQLTFWLFMLLSSDS